MPVTRRAGQGRALCDARRTRIPIPSFPDAEPVLDEAEIVFVLGAVRVDR